MVSMFDDIIQAEDQKFLDFCEEARKRGEVLAAHTQAMLERRRWRDGLGVMHELRPIEAVALTEDFTPRIYDWRVTCGRRRRSTVEHDPTAPLTCLTCLCAPELP